MDILIELNEFLGKEKSKFKVLKREHMSLQKSCEELKEAHDLLLQESKKKSSTSIGISCNILNEMPSVEKVTSSMSTSCDDLLSMPCSSKTDSSNVLPHVHDDMLVSENNNLREQVLKLNKSLERAYKGKATLDKLLSDQRYSFNKALCMFPRKVRSRYTKPRGL